MIEYVLGFCFSPSFKDVILIKKARPDWMRGKLNGIGGKIEENENAFFAMKRECREETGLSIDNWEYFGKLDGCVWLFWAQSDKIFDFKSPTDEQVDVYATDSLIYWAINNKCMANVPALVSLAIGKAFNLQHDKVMINIIK